MTGDWLGVYDLFIAGSNCPSCGKSGTYEFQSKRFKCLFDSYKIGDEVEEGEIVFGHFKHASYTTCKFCNLRFYVDILIQDGKFAGVSNAITEEEYQKYLKERESSK